MSSTFDDSIYRDLFLCDTFPSAVIDRSELIQEVNKAFEDLTLLPAADLRGRPLSEVLEQAVPWIRSTGGDEPSLRVETSDTGSWRLVRLRRLDSEEHERRKENRSEMARLSASVAHDFNNILMAALPWADLLLRQRKDDPGVLEAAAHIRKAIFRARDITQRLLDIAEPVDGK